MMTLGFHTDAFNSASWSFDMCLAWAQRIYPSRSDSLGVTLFARDGGVTVRSLEAWQMSPTNSY
jgi:hypothetical protein